LSPAGRHDVALHRHRVKPEVFVPVSWKAIRVLTSLTWLGLVGCDAFDSDRKPYTPFGTVSSAGSPAQVPDPVKPVVDAGPAREAMGISRGSLLAPVDAREWHVGERKLLAPEGLIFRLGLVGGLAGGKDGDVLSWLVGTPEKPVIGELWMFPEEGAPRLISTASSFLPTGPTCSHETHLDQTGPNSVTLDIRATCAAPLLPRTPERSVSVFAPSRPNAKVAGFRLAAPAPGESLRLELVSRDRDSDGRDDVEMTLAFAAPSAPEVRASFVWLDRPAGLSRDAFEPLASFVRLAAQETARASSSRAAGGASASDVSKAVAAGVANARRLYSTLCAESGVARVALDSGGELSCGDLKPAFEAMTLASINAAVTAGHPEQAFAALERHGWFPTGTKADSNRFVETQQAQLLSKLAKRRVIKLVQLKAQPRAAEAGPHTSPISFHADGSLLLLTAAGVVRAAPDGRFEYDASSEVDAWSMAVMSRGGEQLRGLAFPCDRSEVSWLATAPGGNVLPPIPTELVAPRPGVCQGGSGFEAPRVAPVAWTDEGIAGFIGTSWVGPRPPHPPMGSALSPNGRYSIVATERGLLVSANDKSTLWVFDDSTAPAQLRDCVVSNNAQAAACTMAGRAYVILPDPKTG
jgi:hypothetical protein